jgi:acyl carrier protein
MISSSSQLTQGALQEHLRAQLPDYMVPPVFVRLDSLPLKSSGKVDYAALPAPTLLNTIADKVYLSPRTPVEQQISSILAELLGLERVGVNDNFFFLGGHSLLGTQLIARVRNIFGVELPLRMVFDSPTAAQLSFEVERILTSQISAD